MFHVVKVILVNFDLELILASVMYHRRIMNSVMQLSNLREKKEDKHLEETCRRTWVPFFNFSFFFFCFSCHCQYGNLT